MKEKDFDNLIKSVRQAGKIKRGKMKPSRAFQFDPTDIKGIRLKTHGQNSTTKGDKWI